MSLDSAGDIHPHCLGCVKFSKCNAKPERDGSCEIVPCDIGCGMVFHGCKMKEHRLLCPNEKVPCYNAESGCPCIMPRRYLPKHLLTCPASIVHCTMEWNRWCIDLSTEKKLQWCIQAMQEQQPQFDIALALRDQRILRRWHMSSKNSKNALRNHFKSYPLPFHAGCPSVNSEESSTQEMPGMNETLQNIAHPGLQSSVCNQLCNGESWPSLLNNCHEETVNSHVCDNRYLSKDVRALNDSNKEDKANFVDILQHLTHFCKQYDSTNPKIKSFENGCGEEISSSNEAWEKVSLEQVVQQREGAEVTCFNENVVNAMSSYPTRYLGLGPKLESLLCLPKHMMNTFLCAQEFRRDEYPWHYKNVHSEICSGLNGWLQERCPLAQYGCTFSRQRLHPLPEGSKIVYNEVSESFGVTNISHGNTCNDESKQSILLSHLPFEVLQHIARFLDSFSLSNLALTSTLMREVCQSLLIERGIVTLRWERLAKNNGFSWMVTQKCWSYSQHFSPIKNWTFSDDSCMAKHLKSCKFFKRNKKTEPHFYPMGAPKNNVVFERLKKMSDSSCSESISTKL